MEVNDQFYAPAALHQGIQPPILVGLDAGWAPEPIWTLWRRDKFLPFPAIEPCLSLPVALSLYRLSYPGMLICGSYAGVAAMLVV
jgi:hypothetical protein